MNKRSGFTLALALAMLVISATWLYPAYRAANPDYKYTMNDFTRRTRPICLGRFLIDLPAQVSAKQYWQDIEQFGSIESVPGGNQTLHQFRVLVDAREKELRATPHRTEGSVFRESIQLGGNARLLVFRDDDINTVDFAFETLLLNEGRLFLLKHGAVNARLDTAKKEALDAISKIHVRANDAVPLGKGVCIDNGIVDESAEFRSDSAGVKFFLPDYPGFELDIHIDSVARVDPRGLFERTESPLMSFSSAFPDTNREVKRKARRTLAGMDGEELVMYDITKKNGQNAIHSLAFWWEYAGQEKSLRHPRVTITLDYDFGGQAIYKAEKAAFSEGKPLPSQPSRLTQEEIVSIWDAVLQSIRPRPGAF